MPKKKNRAQLRRCTSCLKVGHNKSTCPASMRNQKNEPNPHHNSVHFFVHHVNSEPPASPHVINLKKVSALWDQVETAAPKKSTNPRYHFYHEEHPPTKRERITFAAMAAGANRIAHKPGPYPVVPQFAGIKKNVELSKLATSSDVVNVPTKNFASTPKKPLIERLQFKRWQTRYTSLANDLENTARSFGNAISSLFQSGFKKRSLAIALVFLLIVGVVPLPARSYYVELQKNKTTIIESGTAGFKALENSTEQLLTANISEASDTTHQALSHFDNAISTLAKYRWLETVASSIPVLKKEVASREKLLLAGQQITIGNTYLLAGLSDAASASTTLLAKANFLLAELPAALPNYEKAVANLNDVSPNILPPEYQETFQKFRSLLTAAVADLKSVAHLTAPINDIFGAEGLRRYLIVFQNPSELRPTGGFIGSFAVLEVKNGTIVKLDIPPGGSYDLQGQLNEFIEPPTPLLLANKRWEFQDANWFPDFKTSSEKLLWFYRHSRGVTLDGVIAINASVFEQALLLTGPITDEKRNVTLTAESGLTTLQKIVEEGPEKKANKPKQIIADIAPNLLERFTSLSPAATLPLLKHVETALNEKDIQLYFTDEHNQASVASFGWSGEIPQIKSDQDYLFVVNTNIQGQKSDARITQNIEHEAVINDDGSVTDTVAITRTHAGSADEKLYGAPNSDYLRVYVPEGSQLLSASGFTWPDDTSFRAPENWYTKDSFLSEHEKLIAIDAASGTHVINEFGKTSFGNWIITRPGQTSRVQFSYRLPFNVITPETSPSATNFLSRLFSKNPSLATYQLIAQRQSGSISSFKSQIIFPTNWSPLWKNGTELSLAQNGAEIELPSFEKDSIWAFAMKKNP